MSEQSKVLRTVTGRVTSNKMNQTISLLVERKVQHPLYKKYVKRSTKIHAHDQNNECNVGDLVSVEQCRPMSKTKTWRLVKVVEQAN